MERIVIEVADATARKWRAIPPRVRTYLEKSFAAQIEDVFEQMKDHDIQNLNREEFKKFLDKISETAKERGLTKEILHQVLND